MHINKYDNLRYNVNLIKDFLFNILQVTVVKCIVIEQVVRGQNSNESILELIVLKMPTLMLYLLLKILHISWSIE